ncbi:AI-2E family transporter [Streptomyces buecherae]|uniref:AI-2E family transporter n=1 Tax=Streptomyces buecherae TaxID=2763006 RepID=UPI0036CFFD24
MPSDRPAPPRAPEPALLPYEVRRVAAWCGALLLMAAVAGVVVWLTVVLKAAVTPVLLALLGSALLGPLYRWLVRRHLNASLAAALTCLALLAVVGGAGYIVVKALVDSGDQIVSSVKDAARDLSGDFEIAGNSVEDMASNGRELADKFGGTAATGLLSGLSVVGQMAAAAFLALLLTFFFLRDADRAVRTLHAYAPRGTGPRLEAVARRAFQAVEGFMRGTTVIALIDAVCITIGLLVLSVPGAVGLGALVFVGAYIPYLGAFLSGAVAVLVAFADGGLAIALWALGVVLAVQVLEGHVLQPVVQSRTVQMHPAVVMITLTAGASLAGILGMLLAVPLTAAAFGVISDLRDDYGHETPGSGGGDGGPGVPGDPGGPGGSGGGAGGPGGGAGPGAGATETGCGGGSEGRDAGPYAAGGPYERPERGRGV